METSSQVNKVEARRGFLKKAAYAAPAVIALGALSIPQSAHASATIKLDNGNVISGNNQQAVDDWADGLFK